ncbi:VanW family protein [Nocardioides sp. MAHUQ-72]|uniref:VanW family protein n=1 Tax=unclassified Nocardioides TaxID=2615069 RepID=UPI00361F0AE5
MSEREKAGGRVVLVVVLVLALLGGGGYAAAYVAAGDEIARGTTIAGVDVGGRTEAEAAALLRRELGPREDAPITLVVDGRSRSITPADAGLAVDHDASVAQAVGARSWRPGHLWDHYTGGQDLEPVLTVDESRLAGLVTRLDRAVGTPATDGAIELRPGRIRVTRPEVGERLDSDEVRAALESAYLEDDPTAEVSLHDQQPDIDAGDVQEAMDAFANPAMSGSVRLVFGKTPVRLQPRQFAPALALQPRDGELVPELDEKALADLVGDAIGEDGAPEDATVALVGGRPRVVPAKPGVTYDQADVNDAFLTLVTREHGERSMKVRATVAEPDFTTRDARKLEIREKVSSFTTYYPYAEYRNTNIGRAAEIVDGTVLEPGETFSLNDTVGERTRENGFTEGFIISDGIFKEDLGGGVSQMATTLFNAMFFAGLEDVEHKPHSFYIDRYPVGREATVAWGSVDLRFRNDTPYGVLIDARVTPSTPSSQGVVTVSMWSTKYWDITSSTSDRYRFVPPETRTLKTDDCYPNTGYDGFDVDVTRHFRKHGESALDHDEVFHTRYIPSDTVICK